MFSVIAVEAMVLKCARRGVSAALASVAWLGLVGSASAAGPASPQDDELRLYAVHIDWTPKQSWPGYGVYLGNGFVLTAAHVAGSFARNKPQVEVAGRQFPTTLIRQGSFDGVDLTLLSVDSSLLPLRTGMRRMPLCQKGPFPGEGVVVAIPEGTARSRVLSPAVLPPDVRGRFSSVIGDVATTGNSGSGVFDARQQCLLGIISRKITVRRMRPGQPLRQFDIAKYFVPAADIKAFLPADASF